MQIDVYNIQCYRYHGSECVQHGTKHPNNKLSGQVLPRDKILMTDLDQLNTQQKSQKFFSKLIAWSSKLQSGRGCFANLGLQVHATDEDHEEFKLDIFEAQFSRNDTMTHPDSTISYFEASHYQFRDISSNNSTSSFIEALIASKWAEDMEVTLKNRTLVPDNIGNDPRLFKARECVLTIKSETKNEMSFLYFQLYFGSLKNMHSRPSFSWTITFDNDSEMEIQAENIKWREDSEAPSLYSENQKNNLFEGELFTYQLVTIHSAKLLEIPIFQKGIKSMSFSKRDTNMTEQHGAQFGKTYADWNALRTFDIIGLRAFRNRVIHDKRTNLQHVVTDTFQLILKDIHSSSSSDGLKFKVESLEFSIVHQKDEHVASNRFIIDNNRNFYLNQLLDDKYVIKRDADLKVETKRTSDEEGYNIIVQFTLSMDLKFNKSEEPEMILLWTLKFQGSSPDRDDETEGSREFIKLTVYVPAPKEQLRKLYDPYWSTDNRNALVIVEAPKTSSTPDSAAPVGKTSG